MSAKRLPLTTRPLASQKSLLIIWSAFEYYAPLKRVLSYVSANPEKVPPLTEAAGVAAMSRGHFARYFHRTTGVSYKHWLDFLRVKRAITLLRFTDKSMFEIAQDCGFTDATTFTRTFFRIEGVTPREFRRACK